jgi:hypothetical protein
MPLLAPVTTQSLSVSPMSIERAFFRVVRILFIRGDARGALA